MLFFFDFAKLTLVYVVFMSVKAFYRNFVSFDVSGTDLTIQPLGSIDRKYMVETLASMVV